MKRISLGARVVAPGRCEFRVWSPNRERVELRIVAPNERTIAMSRNDGGYHEAVVDAREGARYYYVFDGIQRPDPASRFQPEGVHRSTTRSCRWCAIDCGSTSRSPAAVGDAAKHQRGFVIWKLLEMRDTFKDAGYEALAAGRNVCAFARGDDVIVAAPRLLTSLVKPGVFPLRDVWGDADIRRGGRWKNVFTGDTIEGDALPLSGVFERFPVAVLERA